MGSSLVSLSLLCDELCRHRVREGEDRKEREALVSCRVHALGQLKVLPRRPTSQDTKPATCRHPPLRSLVFLLGTQCPSLPQLPSWKLPDAELSAQMRSHRDQGKARSVCACDRPPCSCPRAGGGGPAGQLWWASCCPVTGRGPPACLWNRRHDRWLSFLSQPSDPRFSSVWATFTLQPLWKVVQGPKHSF